MGFPASTGVTTPTATPAARRRGGVILETILVMPLLLMLTFGSAEYSYFFYVKSAMAGAARDGVRAAILASATNASATAAVNTSLAAANVPSAACTVTFAPTDVSTAATGASVTVTVAGPWGTVGVTPLPTAMGGIAATRQVSAAAVMMKE